MTTEERLAKWRELGETYVSKFNANEADDHSELVSTVKELLTWDQDNEDTNKGIIMAWEGVGRRVLLLIGEDDEYKDQVFLLKTLLGDPDVVIPCLTLSIDLVDVAVSEGLDPLDAESYRISISDANGLSLLEDETPHTAVICTE